jgi:hypothetical protein
MKARTCWGISNIALAVVLALLLGAPVLAQETGGLPGDQDTEEQRLQREARREKLGALQDALENEAAEVVSFIVRQVAVECNGNCNDSTLGTLCGPGWRPIAVDCQNVQEYTGGPCGGNNRCARFQVRTGDLLSFYCDDINGWDANVYCAQ